MNITFENKVALVTGAASGLGLATAKAFAEAGAAVVLADWNEQAVHAAAEELAAHGHKVLALRCDVADDTQVEAMVDQTVATFGRLDVAYNNAGVQNVLAETADSPRDDYDRVMAINLRGVWSCMKFELRQMRTQGSGAIVNCSSLGGLVGGAERGTYHAAKHGVLGLTKSAALEYAARGIRINAICPGLFETPMAETMRAGGQTEALEGMLKLVPIGRYGRPEEIADAVLWLCSDRASFVVGQSISVDGGFTTSALVSNSGNSGRSPDRATSGTTRRRTISTEANVAVMASSARASCAWTRARAGVSGTSRWSTTASGTTTRPPHPI